MESESYLNKFIYRTPLLKLSALIKSEDDLLNVFKDKRLRESLYIASNDLFSALLRMENGNIEDPKKRKKLILSLYKYHSRMCTRSTPFGLFSGVNIGSFSPNANDVRISDLLHTNIRLDMGYLCNLYQHLMNDSSLYQFLIFYPNNSLYKLKKQWRYVEYHFNEGENRAHSLVAIDDNIVLRKLLNKTQNGLNYINLIALIKSYGYNEAEANKYLCELISNQVLISQLFPSVSGEEYQFRLLSGIGKIIAEKGNIEIAEIYAILSSNDDIFYKVHKLEPLLSKFNVKINKDHLLQVDLLKQPYSCSINKDVKSEIEKAVEIMSLLTPVSKNNRLDKFKMAFYERYEENPMQLIKVLDSDLGINYTYPLNRNYEVNTVKDLNKEITSFKLNLYTKALRYNTLNVDITDKDIESIKNYRDPLLPLPSSYAFMGNTFYNNDGKMLVRFKAASGPSAINLIGRFGHLHNEIELLCKNLAIAEERNYSNVLFAEIVHLPQGRIGNVITRPHLREYEIPYLAYSTLPLEQQIKVSDLYIKMSDFKLRLLSKKYKKEIIPRLSNSHNFHNNNNLPIYKFLCDLQFQDVTSNIYWSWDILSTEPFLPRVTYKNIIFSLARWNISTQTLRESGLEINLKKFNERIREFNLPDKFVISQGDNELFIDLKSLISIKVFLSFCKKYEKLTLEEFPFKPENVPDGYMNEIIIPFSNNLRTTHIGLNTFKDFNFSYKKYSPLSKCIFFKLYTGRKYAEKILITLIPKLLRELRRKSVIDKWFFIRYSDPNYHLRLRFFIKDYNKREILFSIVKKHIEKYILNDIIEDFQICTYKPEVERYGKNTINESENWFFYNSEMVIKLLIILNDLKSAAKLPYAIFCVDNILNQFEYIIFEKVKFIKSGLNTFSNEFKINEDKSLRFNLNKDFREYHQELIKIMGEKNIGPEDKRTIEVKKICYQNAEASKKILKSIKSKNTVDKINSIAGSFIHMFINRFFNDKQRYREMIIYYRLAKYYDSYIAQNKNQKE